VVPKYSSEGTKFPISNYCQNRNYLFLLEQTVNLRYMYEQLTRNHVANPKVQNSTQCMFEGPKRRNLQ